MGLADHLGSLPEGMHQLVLPQNLVEDWAKQDPTAAFLWASHHPEAATQPGVLASINAIAASPPKQAGAIFSQAIQAEGADPALVIAGLAKALHAEPNPQILTHFLTNLESEDAQEAQLAALFHTSFGPDQSLRSTRVRHLVLSGMTAEQRLGFLDGILHKHGSSPNQFQFDAQFDPSMRDELESLQHSNDEIATIMANFAPLPAPPSP